MLKLFVFDMAGTTVDEDNLVYKTLCLAINEAGIEVPLTMVLTLGAGKEKLQAIKDVLSEVAPEVASTKLPTQIFRDFKGRLVQAYAEAPITQQPGAEAVFKDLKAKGAKVVLNTGYDRSTAKQLLQRLHWEIGRQIDLLVTASDVERGRPHPDMIEKAMLHFDIEDPKEVAKIGDSVIDIEEGQQAGCSFNIGVTTGAHTQTQLERARPETILNSLAELIPYLEGKQAFTS